MIRRIRSLASWMCLSLSLVAGGASTSLALTPTELESSRAKWQDLHWDEYQYEYQRFCFCIGDITRLALVHVGENQVLNVTDLSTLQPLSTTYFPTVEQLFAQLDEALQRPAATIQATFDPIYGFPTDVYIDWELMLADEEVSYRARRATNELTSIACDIDMDRTCAGPIIDLLGDAVREGRYDEVWDSNEDAELNRADIDNFVMNRLLTDYGDSNLDGRFGSSDLVTVFRAGEYRDAVAGNSRWTTGDWDGNRDFEPSDLVFVFQYGGYERNEAVRAAAVPELSLGGTAGWMLLGMTMTVAGRQRRRRRRRPSAANQPA